MQIWLWQYLTQPLGKDKKNPYSRHMELMSTFDEVYTLAPKFQV